MTDQLPYSIPNPDLAILTDNKPRWSTPDYRRKGFQNLHQMIRWGMTLRSDQVLTLSKDVDARIGAREDVRKLTETRYFSAMVVARGQSVLFEKYAPDFGPDRPHTIMSISKTVMNLIIGELVAAGKIVLNAKVSSYIPEMGSGYADATVQQVLNMDLENEYSEDYTDPYTSSFLHETVIGWRLPEDGSRPATQMEFLAGLKSDDITNQTGAANYKSANTDVLAWLAEVVSGKPMRDWLTEIVEAAGLEGSMHMSTDRNGFPIVDGGGCLTARDLARHALLFVRRGQGVAGRQVGCPDFIEKSRKNPGPLMPAPRDWYNYSNQLMTDGEWVGHGGYGGQFMLANLETGLVGVFYSVLENADAYDAEYSVEVTRMLESIAKEDAE